MNKKEKVVFLVDVKGVARKGEIKEVSEAFVKNFLLPQQKVLLYNREVATHLQQQQQQKAQQQRLDFLKDEENFTKLNQKRLFFSLKKKNGQLFGSVTANQISKLLTESFAVKVEKADLKEFSNLKEEGEFVVEIRINKNLTAKVFIVVKSS